MDLNAADFKNQLANLLPAGPAWDLDGSSAEQFLDAWAEEFFRAQARAAALITEADPRSTFDLLPDYERIFGLPTDCMIGVDQTLAQRRNALLAQMTSIGGQSRQYFIDLAAAAGFVITITEFKPFSVGGTVDDVLWGPDWAYAWQVNAPPETVTYFRVTSGVNEALASWGNNLLECLINRFKPAHTIAIFAYA
jgi:uncharacterized protein YmfQ (DUF2313 family)